MNLRHKSALFAAMLMTLAPAGRSTFAAGTYFWQQSGSQTFIKGTFDGTALSRDGRVTLGYSFEKAASTDEPFLWAAAYAPDGALWAGSGNKAILFQVEKGEATPRATLPGAGISAIAFDSRGDIYAAVFPGARIFKIDRKTFDATEFSTTSSTFIWDMKFAGDTLYCATGMPGGIFSIAKDGLASPLHISSEAHFLTMLVDGGSIYAGSSPGGLVFRITPPTASTHAKDAPSGTFPSKKDKSKSVKAIGDSDSNTTDEMTPDTQVTVISDFDEDEVYRLIKLADGRLLAGVNRDQTPPAPAPGEQPPQQIFRNAPVSFPANVPSANPGTPPQFLSKLYFIDQAGIARQALDLPAPYILSMKQLASGEVLIGTGGDGYIFLFDPATERAFMQSIPAQQVLAIAEKPGNVKLATGNPGLIFDAKTSRPASGTYISTVNDSSAGATYGNIHITTTGASHSVKVSTRTGNTPDPRDGTWSQWSDPSAAFPAPVASPAGRYIQYKAEFAPATDNSTPELRDIKIFYITPNQAPIIEMITMSPETKPKPPAGQQPQQTPPPPAPAAPLTPGRNPQVDSTDRNFTVAPPASSALMGVKWKVIDPDNDTLSFSLYVRRIGDPQWIALVEDFDGQELSIPTDSLSDGTYELRLTATDILSNAPSNAIVSELVTAPFVIDHNRPDVKITAIERNGKTVRVTATVHDSYSIIADAEFSINGSDWRKALPGDKIFDSTDETLVISSEAPEDEAITVLIRVNDFLGNIGATTDSRPAVKQ